MNVRTASQITFGFLLAFILQRITSLVATFIVLFATGKVPLLGEFMLQEHLRITLPPIVLGLRSETLLLIVCIGVLLFLLANTGLILWSKRKNFALTRGMQCGFLLLLLPLYTLVQILLVQAGSRSIASEIQERDTLQQEVTEHVNTGDCTSLQPPGQTDCFAQLASEQRDPELCMRIGSGGTMAQFKRDFCLSDVAERAQNPDVCHRIERASVAATCIRKILESMNRHQQTLGNSVFPSHSDLCARFEPKGDIDENEKNACYREVAIFERNPAICDRINLASLRQECKEVLSNQPTSGTKTAPVASSSEASSSITMPGTPFSSAFFTLSFSVPSGFEVRDEQNSIRIAKAPFTDRAIGDDNAFFGLTRFNEYNTQESELARYRKLLVDTRESTITIDGASFLTLSGEDWGRYEGTSAGKVFVVLFPKSWLEIVERPANANQSFDPIAIGKQILATMKFAK